MSRKKPTPTQPAFNAEIAQWIAENRCASREVADELHVSPSFISQILKGTRQSRDGRVERKLRERGAPI